MVSLSKNLKKKIILIFHFCCTFLLHFKCYDTIFLQGQLSGCWTQSMGLLYLILELEALSKKQLFILPGVQHTVCYVSYCNFSINTWKNTYLAKRTTRTFNMELKQYVTSFKDFINSCKIKSISVLVITWRRETDKPDWTVRKTIWSFFTHHTELFQMEIKVQRSKTQLSSIRELK